MFERLAPSNLLVISDLLVNSNNYVSSLPYPYYPNHSLCRHLDGFGDSLAIKRRSVTKAPAAKIWRETFDRPAYGVTGTMILSLDLSTVTFEAIDDNKLPRSNDFNKRFILELKG